MEEPLTRKLFIAFPVTDGLRDEISLLAEYIDPAQLTPTVTENLHMTILYLGEVYDAAIPSLIEIVENVAESARPFTVSGGRTMIMHPDEPYMLWLRFDRNRWFEDLVVEIEKFCWRIGSWKMGRDRKQRRSSGDKYPMPHITLARVPQGRLLDSLLPPYDATRTMREMRCDTLVLLETIRDEKTGKTEYREHARVRLAGR